MKSSEIIVVVDSVENAIKFYTEKLGFDIVEMVTKDGGGLAPSVVFARIKKGKCFLRFRTPRISELAEFSFIKRCSSRSTGLHVEMKKGIEKYFEKCKRKNVPIVHELGQDANGVMRFSIKDPFGVKLMFVQKPKNYSEEITNNFHGIVIEEDRISTSNTELLNEMIAKLREFGILRRAAKKYSKLWIKNYLKAKKK
jgi:uncharacterized glyoxalase superfamily protein PhnB